MVEKFKRLLPNILKTNFNIFMQQLYTIAYIKFSNLRD